MPRATDETFLNKLSQKQKDHPNYSDRLKSRTAFQITHYAGNVQYVFTIICFCAVLLLILPLLKYSFNS
jgi:myosin heavy subunit